MSPSNCLLTIVVVAFGFTCVLCRDVKIHFPQSNSTTFPRLRLQGSLPTLREFTFCAWVRPYDLSRNHSTILSYATLRHSNELLLMLFNSNDKVVFRMYRGDVSRDFGCDSSWTIGGWRHVCLTWLGRNGIVKNYINGHFCAEKILRQPNIPEGGVLILGQDQDQLDSQFDFNQAWHGDVTAVHLWDEVLTENQIKDVSRCGERRREGNIINWLETGMTIFDGVLMSRTEQC